MTTVSRSLTDIHPDMTLDEAYAVQLHQVRHWVGEGRRIRGHKVGLTSAVMQRQLGVDQPDYGHLTDDMFYLESLPIPVDRFISPKVEPEIAFVLKKPLTGPGVTAADALSAVDYALPTLEIIDSRIRDWKITLADTIADNASSGGVVLGSTPVRLSQLTQSGLSLRTMGCVVHQGGQGGGHGRRRRSARVSAQRPGVAGEHRRPARHHPGGRVGDHAGIGDRGRPRRRR